ncbi:MAG: lipid-A-disaccharide synthase [Alphaproteobacteria bacterium]|jgi:lipid-A-disaccharide synthase|nr:lipid-A-disaccharide synthase [Alphaproteobacteria bacterium]
MLVAGEPSGDLLGARLMSALGERTHGRARFFGVGGEAMSAQGLESLFPMSELSVMGLAEVLPRVPRLFRRLRETQAAALAAGPDALVTIDSPGFNFRLAKRLRGHGIPLVHYVAPSVWAWRPGRARKVAGFLDHLLALLPFEPPYFERHGLACSFVGHPAVEGGVGAGEGERFRQGHQVGAAPLVLLLPGSRMMEVGRHLPIFEATLARLRRGQPDLVAALPAAPAVAGAVLTGVGRWPGRNLVVVGEAEKFDAFAAADAALAVSGTVTLELALAATPTVVAYRGNLLSAAIARRLLRIEHVSLANILLGRELQPEFLQENCQADGLAAALEARLAGGADEPLAEAARALKSMLAPDGARPSSRAADVVLEVVRKGRGAS